MKILNKVKTRTLVSLFFLVFSSILLITIIVDFAREDGFISFRGRTEFVVLDIDTSAPQYQWVIAGAYICYDPAWPPPNLVEFDTRSQEGANALCHGRYGHSNRKFIGIPRQISLAFVGNNTLEIAVEPAPPHAEGSLFPGARVPSHVLIVKAAAALVADTNCQDGSGGVTNIIYETGEILQLPEEAELHVPIYEQTLMPFTGRISVGQSNSADTSNLLQSGIVAVYRKTINFVGFRDPQLVRETSLFPGDVLEFEDVHGCLLRSSGFLRAGRDDAGGYVEVVASIEASRGTATVERFTPGAPQHTGRFSIELNFVDAVFTHPSTLWLGFIVAVFLLIKEGHEFLSIEPRRIKRGRRSGRK